MVRMMVMKEVMYQFMGGAHRGLGGNVDNDGDDPVEVKGHF